MNFEILDYLQLKGGSYKVKRKDTRKYKNMKLQ